MAVTQLGYLKFEVLDLGAWERFGTNVLGLSVGARTPSSLTLRMDSYAQRFLLQQGPADDLDGIGWEVEDSAAMNDIGERLARRGHPVNMGTDAECRARKVKGLIKFADPAGISTEVYYGPERGYEGNSAFVAEEKGLGHVVINAKNKAESAAFYQDMLGFRLSDTIVTTVHGYPVDMIFMHANSRHHSLAIGEGQKKRLHHFMIEVSALDDVGLALDRTLAANLRVMQTLGRHPNDRMFSFYARTPSGFQFEFGWGGRIVDDATWKPKTYHAISEWGHHPPEFLLPRAPKTQSESKYQEIGDGLRMHYHEQGSGYPVLFLHGSGPGASGFSNFKNNFPVIAAAGFRALVIDTLGFGDSSKPENVDYTLEFLSGALVRFVKALGLKRCAVVGNSHGGALAIKLALDMPGVVEKIILMAPGGLEDREVYMKMEGIRAMIKAFGDGITRESLRHVFNLQVFDAALIDEATIDERLAVAKTQPKRVLASMQVPNLTPRLGELTCKVLGFWGMQDKFCPVSGATTLATQCERSRVVLINRCGHWVMVEHQEAFNRDVIAFLREA